MAKQKVDDDPVRVAFESWYATNYPHWASDIKGRIPDGYMDTCCHNCWKGWQAGYNVAREQGREGGSS